MTAEERIFSIVRGGLYAKLPSLALPLGRLTCREGDVNHPDQTVEMKASDLIQDPEYIPLETNDSCLIRNGATFYATDDYIVSIARRQIYLFDRRTGRFVREIGKAGEGPNDYLMVTRVWSF